METLLNAEMVTSDHNLRGLRHLYDLTELHIRSLKSLGVKVTSYEAMLSSVFFAKLPPNLRLTVSRRVPASEMDKLLTLFEDELVAREHAHFKSPFS